MTDDKLFDMAYTDEDHIVGLGFVHAEVDEDHSHVLVDADYLKRAIELVDALDLGYVRLSIKDEEPLVIRDEDRSEKPAVAVAPRITGSNNEEESG